MNTQDCILLFFAKRGIVADARPWSKHRRIWNSLEPAERDEIRDEIGNLVAAHIGKTYRTARRNISAADVGQVTHKARCGCGPSVPIGKGMCVCLSIPAAEEGTGTNE